MLKNPPRLSFRGAAGDEESRIVLKTLRARFLTPLGMTAWKGFSPTCEAPPFQTRGEKGRVKPSPFRLPTQNGSA